MKKRTLWITLIIVALAATGIFYSRTVLSGKSETDQPLILKKAPTPLVRVMEASAGTISSGLEVTGSVEPYRIARLASPAEGPVLHIRAREGDRVNSGDALLSIGRKEGIDARIASLREELGKEEDNLARTRQLCESEALPGEQLDQAMTAFEKVRAELIQAEETARDYDVKAPWTGVVSRVIVKEGEFVAPRAVLLEMYDPESLVIRAAVPEKHAAAITVGMRVDVRLDAYPDDIIDGRIERVYPYLDARLRTRTMEIALNESTYLLPGMFARLNVSMQNIDNAVTVPAEALVTTPKGLAVFVVEDGKAVKRPVVTGMEEGNRIQIVTGVRPGDKVVVAGNDKLKDGAAVRFEGNEKTGKGTKNGTAAPSPGQKKKAKGGDR